jgi:hypothetical protein
MSGEQANERETSSAAETTELVLRFSHNIIDHLGLKLYQNRPTNVLAELVANAWDAGAEHVWIDVSTSTEDRDRRYIAVGDDGCGMDLHTLANTYLIIGLPKDRSAFRAGARRPMGRKGIGKLAPFGIAQSMDILTVAKHDGSREATWIRLDSEEILDVQSPRKPLDQRIYNPTILFKAVDPSTIDPSSDETGSVQKFLGRLDGKTGTLVLLRKLSLMRSIGEDTVRQSMGRRFTVTLTRQDFVVEVNGRPVTEEEALPKFEFRIPADGKVIEKVGSREVSYWVGFVETAEWPQDEAGVGVYAHGKIAQDRPHTFGLKGREIFTRYMYGVVEADWLDDLPQDIVSTDRTSIDWDHPEAAALREWGRGKLRSWIDAYRNWQAKRGQRKVRARVDERIVARQLPNIREDEKEVISELIAEVTPGLGKDDETLDQVTAAVLRAYLHRPMREILKQVWDRLSDAADLSAQAFLQTVDELSQHAIPETLSLAVVFAQRAYALGLLDEIIHKGTEPELQKLIERFPWILRPDMVKLTANQQLKTLVMEAGRRGLSPSRTMPGQVDINEQYKPDFVFFSDIQRMDLVVVEIKSPREELTIANREQLVAYMVFLEQQYPDANRRGFLVGTKPENLESNYRLIEILSWQDIFRSSRYGHLELLAAMLRFAAPDGDDDRVQQIREFGGDATWELLERLAAKDEELSELFDTFPRSSVGAPRPKAT